MITFSEDWNLVVPIENQWRTSTASVKNQCSHATSKEKDQILWLHLYMLTDSICLTEPNGGRIVYFKELSGILCDNCRIHSHMRILLFLC